MKNIFMLIFLILFSTSNPTFASDDHEHKDEHGHGEEHGDHNEASEPEETEASNVGADKGVLEASRKKGMKLTQAAIKTLGVSTKEMTVESIFSVPKSSIVTMKRENFIYIKNGDFYRGFPLVILQKGESYKVRFEEKVDLKKFDLVVNGAHFLRNIEVDIFSGDEGGHHH